MWKLPGMSEVTLKYDQAVIRPAVKVTPRLRDTGTFARYWLTFKTHFTAGCSSVNMTPERRLLCWVMEEDLFCLHRKIRINIFNVSPGISFMFYWRLWILVSVFILKDFKIHMKCPHCWRFFKNLSNWQFPLTITIHVSVCLSCLHLTNDGSQPPLRTGWKSASQRITHEESPLMEGHIGFRPEEEGGDGLMDNFPAEQEKKRNHLTPSLFLAHSISPVVSLGSKCIDLNLYWKKIKSEREIIF